MVYFGLSYGVDVLPGNLYLNNAIGGLIEIVAAVLCMIYLDRVGRKWITAGCMIIGGTALLASMLINEYAEKDNEWISQLSRWIVFVGKFAVAGSYTVIYIFAAELYPTEVRSIGISFVSAIGCIGGILTPFIILLQSKAGLSYVPYFIFGVTSILSGLWTLKLPETAGQPIFQTIAEAEQFYKRSCRKRKE